MRVLYFSQGYTTHDRRFLSKLAESSHQIFYLRLENDSTTFEKRMLPDSIEPIQWPDSHSSANNIEELLRRMPQFEEIIQRIAPDLVHAGPVTSCGFITALSGFHPFLVMSWGSDILLESDSSPVANWMIRYTLEHSDGMACDCHAVLAKTNLLANYADRAIAQFPWGIDPTAFSPGMSQIRGQLGWDSNFIILSTRTWESIYGIDTLLEAFRMAAADNNNLRLLLLADGSLTSRYEEFIHINNLEHLIYRPGRISEDQLQDYYRCADLYVSASITDGSSVSLLEAMATGLAVAVTDIPGNREWVTDGEGGWLWPTSDPVSLTNVILTASAADETFRSRMGETNRRIVKDRADWNRNFPKLLDVYNVLANRSPAPNAE